MVFEVYTDAVGHHLWRLRRKTGDFVIAVSAMKYTTREECLECVRLVAAADVDTPVLVLESPPPGT